MSNIALFPGNIVFDKVFLNQKHKIKVLLGSPLLLKPWETLQVPIYSIRDLEKPFQYDQKRNKIEPTLKLDALRYVYSDIHTHHIIQRRLGTLSMYEHDLVISDVIDWTLLIIEKFDIDTVINHNTPHELVTFIFNKVAAFLNLRTFNIARSPIFWCGMIEDSAFFGNIFKIPDSNKGKVEHPSTESIIAYVNSKVKSYDEGIPEYELKRKTAYADRYWDWHKEVKFIFRSSKKIPQRVKTTVKRYKFLKGYFALEEKSWESERFVTFFLHYQPERTTLPEGDIFTQQFNAIRTLRDVLPSEVRLLVKEHPSTFRNTLNLKVRNIEFYKKIVNLPNTKITPLSVNPFNLIDRSLFISTITGSVIFEASARGKSSVYFGHIIYKGMPGAVYFEEILKNQKSMENLLGGLNNPSKSEVIQYFETCRSFSYGSLENDEFFNSKRHYQNLTYCLSGLLNSINKKRI